VDNRGRRRDGDLVLTIVRVAFDRAVEGRLPDLPAAVGSMRRSAGGLRFSALADALGAFLELRVFRVCLCFGIPAFLEYPPKDFSSAPCSQLRRRFFCGVRESRGCIWVPFAGRDERTGADGGADDGCFLPDVVSAA
jgi:hypothetical protein